MENRRQQFCSYNYKNVCDVSFNIKRLFAACLSYQRKWILHTHLGYHRTFYGISLLSHQPFHFDTFMPLDKAFLSKAFSKAFFHKSRCVSLELEFSIETF